VNAKNVAAAVALVAAKKKISKLFVVGYLLMVVKPITNNR